MKNIVLTRIDDRLIHGQVVTAWTNFVGANNIIIVDDVLSKNKMMQRIYRAAAPSGIDVNIFTLEDALTFLKDNDPSQKVMILVKTPQVIKHLIEGGIDIKEVILGGMGSNAQRTQLIRNVSASDDERELMKEMISQGIDIHFQLVPDQSKVDLNKIL